MPPGSLRAPKRASRKQLEGIVEETSRRYGLDPRLVRAVVRVESSWNPRAVSTKEAKGLMQLIPATAERFDVQNVFNPAENVEGGVRYLADLLSRYHGNLSEALAAYYSGEQTVDHARGVPAEQDIQAYVEHVTRLYRASVVQAEEFGSLAIHRFVESDGRVVYTNQ